MFCGTCGNILKDPDVQFCELCGSEIKKPLDTMSKEQEELIRLRLQEQEELRGLRREVSYLRDEARKSARWRDTQKSCCYCYISMIIIVVIFATIIPILMFMNYWP